MITATASSIQSHPTIPIMLPPIMPFMPIIPPMPIIPSIPSSGTTTSTTAMLALGDALALVVSRMKDFTADDFARFHPGGSLGLKLANVEQAMRPAADCRFARVDQSVREALVAQSRPGRRTGAVMVVDSDGRLAGIFTDSDLARLLEWKRDADIDGPMAAVMTASPTAVGVGTRLSAAFEILAQKKISELPVIDADGCPIGMIDITDVVGLVAQSEQLQEPPSQSTSLQVTEDVCVTADGQLISVPITKARRGER